MLTGVDASRSAGETAGVRAALGAATLAFVFLVVIAGAGVRGADPYWYLADAETVARGEPWISNNVFPSQVLGPKPTTTPEFIHNILPVYVAGYVARGLGAYAAWLVVNTVASLAAAFLVYRLVAGETTPRVGAAAYAVQLLLPLTFWQGAQPWAEPLVALAGIGMVYLYVHLGRREWGWLGLLVVMALGYCCREVFLPAMDLLPVAYLARAGWRRPRHWLMAGLLAAGVWSIVHWQPLWFPQTPAGSWSRLLSNAIPDVTDNMFEYFALTEVPLTAGLLARKWATNLWLQFDPTSLATWVFHLPYNLLVLVVLASLAMRDPRSVIRTRLLLATGVFLGIHLITILLVQNHARYMLPTQPVLVAAAFTAPWWAGCWRRRFPTGLGLAVVVAVLAGVNVAPALRLRHEGMVEARQRGEMVAELREVVRPGEALIMQADRGVFLPAGYAFRPHPVLFLNTRYAYRPDQIEAMRVRFGATWLLCETNGTLPALCGLTNPPSRLSAASALAGYGWYPLDPVPGK